MSLKKDGLYHDAIPSSKSVRDMVASLSYTGEAVYDMLTIGIFTRHST